MYKMFEQYEPEKVMAIIDRLDIDKSKKSRMKKACRDGAKITLTKNSIQIYIDEIKLKLESEIKKTEERF